MAFQYAPTNPMEKAFWDYYMKLAKGQRPALQEEALGVVRGIPTETMAPLTEEEKQARFAKEWRPSEEAFRRRYGQLEERRGLYGMGPTEALKARTAGEESRSMQDVMAGLRERWWGQEFERRKFGTETQFGKAGFMAGLPSPQATAMGYYQGIPMQREQWAKQEAMMKRMAKAQMWSSIFGAGGAIGGAAIAASSRDFKKNIEKVENFDEILKEVAKTDVVTYQFKNETGGKHIGLIAEDAPEIIATKDRKGLKVVDYLGYLFAAVKALTEEVKELKGRP